MTDNNDQYKQNEESIKKIYDDFISLMKEVFTLYETPYSSEQLEYAARLLIAFYLGNQIGYDFLKYNDTRIDIKVAILPSIFPIIYCNRDSDKRLNFQIDFNRFYPDYVVSKIRNVNSFNFDNAYDGFLFTGIEMAVQHLKILNEEVPRISSSTDHIKGVYNTKKIPSDFANDIDYKIEVLDLQIRFAKQHFPQYVEKLKAKYDYLTRISPNNDGRLRNFIRRFQKQK